MNDLFRPLRHRSFAMLWGGTFLANLGFYFQDLTLGWLMVGTTDSPVQIALVPFATSLPVVLLSLPAGAIADRVDRRKLLLALQACLVTAILAFCIAISVTKITVASILSFAFVTGILMAMAGPARQAILPSIVAQHEVHSAVSLSAISFNFSRTIGPMIAGIFLATFGSQASLLVYAGSAAVVGLSLLLWLPAGTSTRAAIGFGADLFNGPRYVLRHAGMRQALIASFMYFVCVSPVWAFLPLIAKHFADGQSDVFSMFMVAIGLGAVAGGLTRLAKNGGTFGRAMLTGAITTAMGMIFVSLADNRLLSLTGFFISGIGWIRVSASINSYVLSVADAAFRGRSIAVVLMVFASGMSLGSLLWGRISEIVGTHGAFAVGAAFLILLGLFFWVRVCPRDIAR